MYASTALTDATSLQDHEAGQHAVRKMALDAAPSVDSSELLKGNKAVTIQHNGLIYRLQATKLGKLILTK